jgi:hypothetical protein
VNTAKTDRAKEPVPKQPLPDALAEFTTVGMSSSRPGSEYTIAHMQMEEREAAALYLKEFLKANMDELRLFYAEKYSHAVLRLSDHEDAMYFRHGVLRRELSGDMDYEKQRDHASHTLNNYLLGWYLLCHSDRVAAQMAEHLRRRFPESDRSFYQQFGNIWPIASLLHDVGYIFEGGLRSLDTNAAVAKARKGAEYVQDFFQTLFWEEVRLGPTHFRDKVEKLTGVTTPRIDGGSLAQISQSLRHLGKLDTLFEAVIEEKPEFAPLLKDVGPDSGPLGDAFFIWETNYLCFEQPTMAERVRELEVAHAWMLREGIPGLGIRVLDHGIAGGMLLLLHSTLYHRMHFGMRSRKASVVSDSSEGLEEAFLSNRLSLSTDAELERRIRLRLKEAKYEASWWWRAIVWATAAVAIHNVQTMDPWPGSPKPNRLLRLSDDPLAYLGILVDLLQEWDRYTTSRNSVFTGELPVSSADVGIGVSKGVVYVDYGTGKVAERAAKKVANELNKSLHGWKEIVQISPSSIT